MHLRDHGNAVRHGVHARFTCDAPAEMLLPQIVVDTSTVAIATGQSGGRSTGRNSSPALMSNIRHSDRNVGALPGLEVHAERDLVDVLAPVGPISVGVARPQAAHRLQRQALDLPGGRQQRPTASRAHGSVGATRGSLAKSATSSGRRALLQNQSHRIVLKF
jgi:hypothetical protein